VEPAQRPLLVLAPGRPRGSRVRARLVAAAERRGMIVAALKAPDRLRALDRIVEATQPDAVLVCAEPPVQAELAAVAASRDIPFACMPSGPDDLLARDLGAVLDDPAEALSLPFSSTERTIDLAEVNGVEFVNYAAVGLELPATVSHAHRGPRRKPLPGPGRARSRTRVAGSPAAERSPALLVCNNRFELRADGLGERDWPGSGRLQVIEFHTARAERNFAAVRREGWQERSCASFELPLRSPVRVDIDGEPRELRPPLRFRCLHSALRVRTPPSTARTAGATRKTPAKLESLRTG
jgi:diacylglycerol kinase family enzyme